MRSICVLIPSILGIVLPGCAHSTEQAPARTAAFGTETYAASRWLGPVAVTNQTRSESAEDDAPMIQVDPGLPESPMEMRLGALEDVCHDTSVHFEVDSAELDATARRVLDHLADCLRREHIRSIRVTGHADPRGTRPYNHALGRARARAVAVYLRDRGADPTDRIRVESRGEEAARWQAYWDDDRRVDVVAEPAQDHD